MEVKKKKKEKHWDAYFLVRFQTKFPVLLQKQFLSLVENKLLLPKNLNIF